MQNYVSVGNQKIPKSTVTYTDMKPNYQIDLIKKDFFDKFYKPRGIEGWHIEGTIADIWNFIESHLQDAYKQGKKDGRDEVYKMLHNINRWPKQGK